MGLLGKSTQSGAVPQPCLPASDLVPDEMALQRGHLETWEEGMCSTAIPHPGIVLHTAWRAAAQIDLVHGPWHAHGFPLWRGLNLTFLALLTP